MRALAGVLYMFREDHGGMNPTSLKELYPEYLTDLQILKCALDQSRIPFLIEDAFNQSSFILGLQGNAIELLEKERRHNDKRLVLKVNGEFYKE